MNRKIAMVLIPLLLMSTFAFLGKTSAQPTINIGIIGPQGLPHWSPGMWEAAQMAVEEINTAGGVNLGGTTYYFAVKPGNEHAVPVPNPSAAAAEVERLITQEWCKFIIGGFRTEVTGPMIEKAADWGVPFFICGASTNELITETVWKDYGRYKYIFRVTPVNSSQLLYTMTLYIKQYLLPQILVPMYGYDLDNNPATPPQVRVAVLTEALKWTEVIHYLLTNPATYPALLGPHANVTYEARVPEDAGLPGGPPIGDFLNPVKTNKCHLMIIVFSGRAGAPLVYTWYSSKIKALVVGINVLSQLRSFYYTSPPTPPGSCQYEVTMKNTGTRTPVTPKAVEFWDKFVARTGDWPIYTAWGAYDAIYALKEALESLSPECANQVINYLNAEPGTMPAPDCLIEAFEATERWGLTKIFKYTSHPTLGPRKGHDVYSQSPGVYWPDNYTRAMMVQWLNISGNGVQEVVSPIDQLYSRRTIVPPWMYGLYLYDLNLDGKVDMSDVGIALRAFGAKPGHPRWEMGKADTNLDGKVDMSDIGAVLRKFGKMAPSWPLPDDDP